jgi:hypothetical protein
VHFTKTEIIWECRSIQKFQNGASIGTSIGLAYRFALAKENAEHFWKTLVADYSKRSLTYESDRLPAISGVASELNVMNPSWQYLAGIWKQWLFSELLWIASWGEQNQHPPQAKPLDEMPSWSWASIVGQIFYKFEGCEGSDKNVALKVIAVNSEPEGRNPFGRLKKNASIVLEARIFEVKILSKDPRNSGTYSILAGGKIPTSGKFWPDAVLVEGAGAQPASDAQFQASGIVRRLSSKESPGSNAASLSVLCIYLGGGRYSTLPDRKFPSLKATKTNHFYLIVSPVASHQSSPNLVLTRLGLLEMTAGPSWSAKKTRVVVV